MYYHLYAANYNNQVPNINCFHHQANLRIISATAKRLKLPMSKVAVNLERYGNTSSASIPIALDEVVRNERIKENDYVLLEAFGSGLTWGSALIRW